VDAAEAAFAEFEADWGSRYPAIIRLWRNAWDTFTPFLTFPPEIRRVVYTTNAIESLNARLRQATRRRGHFPNEQAALKVLYLVIRTPRPNRANVTGTPPDGRKRSTPAPCTTANGSPDSRGDHRLTHKDPDSPTVWYAKIDCGVHRSCCGHVGESEAQAAAPRP
jgi:hypothetical protein